MYKRKKEPSKNDEAKVRKRRRLTDSKVIEYVNNEYGLCKATNMTAELAESLDPVKILVECTIHPLCSFHGSLLEFDHEHLVSCSAKHDVPICEFESDYEVFINRKDCKYIDFEREFEENEDIKLLDFTVSCNRCSEFVGSLKDYAKHYAVCHVTKGSSQETCL